MIPWVVHCGAEQLLHKPSSGVSAVAKQALCHSPLRRRHFILKQCHLLLEQLLNLESWETLQ